MPVQHFLPVRQTRSQAVFTPTPRAPLVGTPAVPQMRAHLDKGLIIEGEAPPRKEGGGPIILSSFSGVVSTFPGISRTTLNGPGKNGAEEEENSVEEEESDSTEADPTPVRESQRTGGPNIAQYNQPVSPQCEPYLLEIMQKMIQIMANILKLQDHQPSRLHL
ncbi:hypothetical protein O181_063149 [Austropuccinia psidii MF-1]|uniref:Uncharacterized protein n=1 Tax=Austropuccinia psidii MF-1 TaxID=1389203 RepID=A0A9Q3I295_9BASI|nr:hypothetical protein [Austropuccinia psidii MF-1]